MRILIVTEELNSVVWTFAKSLHQQKQDVLILTSRDTDFDGVPPFPILTPFKTWSFLEGLKVLPRIASWNPDILHCFYTHEDHHPRPAQWILSAFAASLPNKTLAASYFVDGAIRPFRDRAFLKLFDVNTFGTRTQLMRMKRQKMLPSHAIVDVLPPIESEMLFESSRIRPEVEKLVATLGRFVLMPDPPPKPLNTKLLAQRGFEVLVLSERFRPRSWHYSTGTLTTAERDYVFSKATALLLAECDLSVLELRRFHEMCERNQLPVIVTAYQNELLPGLCWNGKSGWVLDQGLAGLSRVLDENPELQLSKSFTGVSGQELMDNALNELLRLYQKAYLLRWT